MKNIHTKKRKASVFLWERQARKLVVVPVACQIKRHAVMGLKLGRRILEKLQEIAESMDIIAREIARQSKQGK